MRALIAACVLCVGILAWRPAWGEKPGEREARAIFMEANKLLDDGDYVHALELYRSAYERFPAARILLNMGTALKALGRNAEAVETYQRFLDDPGHDSKWDKEVGDLVKELGAKIGRLRIVVNEPGAKVLVNGNVVGESPQAISLRVEPGSYTVVAQKEGYPAALATVAVAAGDDRVVELRLESSSVKPDEKPEAPEAAVEPGVGAGAVAPDRGEPPKWYQDKLGWGLAASGLVVAGIGSGLLVHASGLREDAASSTDEDEVVRLNDSANTYRTTGVVFLVVGAAVATTGVVKLVLHDAPSGHVEVAGGLGWVGLQGRF